MLLALTALGKEVLRDLREHDVAQHILLAARGVSQRLLRLFIGVGGQRRGIASLDRLLAAEYLRADLRIDRRGRTAVFAAAVGAHLRTDVLVPLPCQHVLHGLRADELARRGDERRIAHVLADARRLEQRLVELVQRVHHLELAEKV